MSLYTTIVSIAWLVAFIVLVLALAGVGFEEMKRNYLSLSLFWFPRSLQKLWHCINTGTTRYDSPRMVCTVFVDC